MEGQGSRPAVVTALGWLFVAGAGLMMLSAMGGLAASVLMKGMGPEDMPAGAEAPAFVRYFSVLCVLQIAFAAFVAVAAAYFLRLRAWARTALEAATWVGLAWVVGFGVFWVVNWLGRTSQVSAEPGRAAGFSAFGAVVGTIITLVFVAPCVIVIWLLRGRQVREALAAAERRAGMARGA